MISATLEQPVPAEENACEPNRIEPQLSALDLSVATHCANVASIRSLREFGYVLANSLCNQFQCEQVGIGFVRGKQVDVISISGCTDFKAGNPGVVEMRQAMEECFDLGDAIVFPPAAGTTALPIHRQWSIHSNGAQVCSLPIRLNEQLVGVASLRRNANLPFTADNIESIDLAIRPFGALLSLIDRANRPVAQHLRASTTQWLCAHRSPLRIVMAVSLTILLSWFSFGVMPYRPFCDSMVVASQTRNMTAPYEARLEQIHVQAGDEVSEGDVLVEFDTNRVELERETIRAEIARTIVSERAAVDAGNASAAAIQRAHLHVLAAKQASLDNQIDRAILRAPDDGLIIRSNCDKRLGQVFAQGDTVLQFAAHAGWELNVHAPEGVAVHLESGQNGSFASLARPYEKVNFLIEQINGSAEIVEGQNVFVARAALQGNPEWMRSGMRGIARVTTVKKPVWWVALHKLVDWTRLRFWL